MPDDGPSSPAPHGEVVKLDYASDTAGGVVTEEDAEGVRFLLPRGNAIIAIAAGMFGVGGFLFILVWPLLSGINRAWGMPSELLTLIAVLVVIAVLIFMGGRGRIAQQSVMLGASARGLSVIVADDAGGAYLIPREHLEQVWLVRGWVHIDLNTTWRLVVQTDEGLYSIEFDLARSVPGRQIEGRLRHTLDLPESQQTPPRFFMYRTFKRWRANRPSAKDAQ